MVKINRRGRPARPSAEKTNCVIKLVLSGMTPFDITEELKVLYPEDDTGRLILSAMVHFENVSKSDPRVVIGWCFEATKDIYRRMLVAGDFHGALKAVKQIVEVSHYVYDEDEEGEEPTVKRISAAEPGEVGGEVEEDKRDEPGHRGDSPGEESGEKSPVQE